MLRPHSAYDLEKEPEWYYTGTYGEPIYKMIITAIDANHIYYFKRTFGETSAKGLLTKTFLPPPEIFKYLLKILTPGEMLVKKLLTQITQLRTTNSELLPLLC